MSEVLVPSDLWSDDREAAISVWLYQDGDRVEAGSVIAEVMVEKTSYEITAPCSGLLEILIEADETVTKGQAVALIE